MSQLENIPVELFIAILRYVPLQSLYTLQLVSRYVRTIIVTNGTAIFHQAALYHNYVSSLEIALSDVKESNPAYPFGDVCSWKEYCAKCFRLDENWAGIGSAEQRVYCEARPDVHRIKVDEERALLITSHELFGICVTDTSTGTELWRISVVHVRQWAHVEYENGFLIFDCRSGDKEVWRVASEYDPSELPRTSPPDERQWRADADAREHYPGISHGHFRPWALFRSPENTRAYRFVYPTLCTIGTNSAFLWDVPTGRLVQTIHHLQDLHGGATLLGAVNYVDVNAEYLFVCGASEFRVFSRSNGVLVMRVPQYAPTLIRTRVALDVPQDHEGDTVVVPVTGHVLTLQENPPLPVSSHERYFGAAHVSRDGRHLAILLKDNRLLIVGDFERIIKGQAALEDIAIEIYFAVSEPAQWWEVGRLSMYLAFEYDRISVVTLAGIYILVLDATKHGLFDPEHPHSADSRLGILKDYKLISADASFPFIASSCLLRLREEAGLVDVSCLQLTPTRLYTTWRSVYLPAPSRVPLEDPGKVQDTTMAHEPQASIGNITATEPAVATSSSTSGDTPQHTISVDEYEEEDDDDDGYDFMVDEDFVPDEVDEADEVFALPPLRDPENVIIVYCVDFNPDVRIGSNI